MKPDGWDRIFQDLEPMIMNGIKAVKSGRFNNSHRNFRQHELAPSALLRVFSNCLQLSGDRCRYFERWNFIYWVYLGKKRFKSHKTELLGDRNPAHP